MKAIFLTLFFVAVSAAPVPKDSDAVEMVVNGVPDGAALEVGNLLDIKLKEHADGAVVATDLLHPYTAVGIAEAAAAAAAAAADAAANEVSVADMERSLKTMPVVKPEDLSQPEPLPVAAPQNNGLLYNDGLVQVQYNGPEEPGMLSTLQDWFNLVINYFNPASSPASPPSPSALQPRH